VSEKGKIIILNGVTSAGKTTLAKSLQANLTEPFYLLSYDAFCAMSPRKHQEINPRQTHQKIKTGFHHAIKLFSDMGINVIVDHVILEGKGERTNHTNLYDLEECVWLLHAYEVVFVHVTCSLEELRRREIERGDRVPGTAEYQLPRINPQDTYDITVDTFTESIESCAERVIEILAHTEKHVAFKTLWEESNVVEAPKLTTERLILRHIQPDDAKHLTYLLHPDIQKGAGPYMPHTAADLPQHIERIQGDTSWFITLPSGEVIGDIGVFSIQGNETGEMAWYLAPAHWYKGYAAEAGQAVVAYMFDTLALRALTAQIDSHNTPSRRLAEKLGFQLTRTQADADLHGQKAESCAYSIRNPAAPL